jgi:Ras-related protein Rab-5C
MGEKVKEYKVCLLGDAGVGKTSILSKQFRGRIDVDSCATIGSSFQMSKMYNSAGDPLKLMIWDTAGQERYRSMIQIYTRGCRIFILVYDLSYQESFNSIKNFWMNYAAQSVVGDEKNCLFFVVANKSDLVDGSQLLLERLNEGYSYIKTLQDKYHIKFLHTSAKTGNSISNLFAEIVDSIEEHDIKPSVQIKSLIDEYKTPETNKNDNSWGTYLYNQAWKCNIL